MIRKLIIVKGVVQGVGFRPFIYKIALKNNLKGTVKNTSNGVYIDIEGSIDNYKNFYKDIKYNSPILSVIESIDVINKNIVGYETFKIINSEKEDGFTLISPDIATCNDCLKDIDNKYDKRRGKYSFTNCTNCGPRYTIIKNIPYDRSFTTMRNFKMCNSCEKEYENPLNRRFHAEPTCCNECGPKVELLDSTGKKVEREDPIKYARSLIKKGKIIAVKGIGGFNIICDGENYSAIERLRSKKHRARKPLALMMKDIDVASKYCNFNSTEENILNGNKKPIVLLKRKNNKLPTNIAFNSSNFGVLLPYSPLHYLLFKDGIETIVFTSANITGEPIIYKNDEALEKLEQIVDYFLIHNREINMPIDDSIVKVVLGEERIIRGGRGYYPIFIKKHIEKNILALGSQFKNTISINYKDYIIISPYIGDLDNKDSNERFNKVMNHFKNIYNMEIDEVCRDMHPGYFSNSNKHLYSNKFNNIYHHHAHIAACMGENEENDYVIGITFDGTGYGEDKNIWGGEFLICNLKEFKRGAYLNYFKLPGGDSAIKSPWKIGISLLNKSLETNKERLYEIEKKYISENEVNIKFIESIIDKNISCPLTSSIGRLFDGISALLGFNGDITYESEGAIYVEELANKHIGNKEEYEFELKEKNDDIEINTKKLVLGIVDDLERGIEPSIIAIKFHNTIISLTIKTTLKLKEKYNISKVCLSGGVFQNEILFKGIVNGLKQYGFNVITHKKIPCNDSSISFGQLLIGSNK